MPELKPCPFCNGKARLARFEGLDNKTYFFIKCSEQTCQSEGPAALTEDEAFEKWNTRA